MGTGRSGMDGARTGGRGRRAWRLLPPLPTTIRRLMLIILVASVHVVSFLAMDAPEGRTGETAAAPTPGQEAPRRRVGVVRFFTNDQIGDGQDRWRTGSYQVSFIQARNWSDRLGEHFGDVAETRLRSEIIAPATLTMAPPLDRPYAGVLSVGRHFWWRRGALDLRLGGDLVLIGPASGMSAFQGFVHNIAGLPRPTVHASQLGNALYPTVSVAATREIRLGRRAMFSPFVEAEAGVETYARIGFDLAFGRIGDGVVRPRDVVSGQRNSGTGPMRGTGWSFTLGGDIARVVSSAYLPAGRGTAPEPWRSRLRLGVAYGGQRHGFFYGLTWLGREFVGQPSGQVVGTLSLALDF